MSVISPSRQLSVPLLDILEGRGTEPWAVKVLRMGYHLPLSLRFPFLHQGERASEGSSVTPGGGGGGGGYRTCTWSSVSGLLQPSLCSLEDLWVVEGCHRPCAPETSRHPNSVQNGDQSVSPPCRLEG